MSFFSPINPLNGESIPEPSHDEVYQLKRKYEYPSIGDQLDALWKGGQAAAEMKAQIDAIKTKYPKP